MLTKDEREALESEGASCAKAVTALTRARDSEENNSEWSESHNSWIAHYEALSGAIAAALSDLDAKDEEIAHLKEHVPDHVAASARVIGLHLDEFCDKNTEGTYYDMIAEASRRAHQEIIRLREVFTILNDPRFMGVKRYPTGIVVRIKRGDQYFLNDQEPSVLTALEWAKRMFAQWDTTAPVESRQYHQLTPEEVMEEIDRRAALPILCRGMWCKYCAGASVGDDGKTAIPRCKKQEELPIQHLVLRSAKVPAKACPLYEEADRGG